MFVLSVEMCDDECLRFAVSFKLSSPPGGLHQALLVLLLPQPDLLLRPRHLLLHLHQVLVRLLLALLQAIRVQPVIYYSLCLSSSKFKIAKSAKHFGLIVLQIASI